MANFFVKNANTAPKTIPIADSYHLYVDRLSNKDGSGASLIIETPQGKKHEHILKFIFKASNIKVEYKALIARVELYYTVGADSVRA